MGSRDGARDSARLIRMEKTCNWKGYFQDVGISLSPSLERLEDNDVDEGRSLGEGRKKRFGLNSDGVWLA